MEDHNGESHGKELMQHEMETRVTLGLHKKYLPLQKARVKCSRFEYTTLDFFRGADLRRRGGDEMRIPSFLMESNKPPSGYSYV